MSTKLLRLPTRGALGNGLRVVTGTILASGGSLVVTTRNRRIELRPERDGTTTVLSTKKVNFPVGTRVEIRLGPALPADTTTDSGVTWRVDWRSAGHSTPASRRPGGTTLINSPNCFSAAATGRCRDLIANLDGCSGARAGEIVAAAGLGRTACRDVTMAGGCHASARGARLREAGQPEASWHNRTVRVPGIFVCGRLTARPALAQDPRSAIPFVVEAWVAVASSTSIVVCVNRTPITETCARRGIGATLTRTGVAASPALRRREGRSIQYMGQHHDPVHADHVDGKAPESGRSLMRSQRRCRRRWRSAYRPGSTDKTFTEECCSENLDDAMRKTSGNGAYRSTSVRFISMRPIVRNKLDAELTRSNFSASLPIPKLNIGEIPACTGAARVDLHPHRGETITLGDLMVRNTSGGLAVQQDCLTSKKKVFGSAERCSGQNGMIAC